MVSRALGISLLALVVVCPGIAAAQAPQPSVQERVAILKGTFAASQANLREDEWIETTVVSLNGEEKSRKQQRCYYGGFGMLQKVLVDASPPPATKPGMS